MVSPSNHERAIGGSSDSAHATRFAQEQPRTCYGVSGYEQCYRRRLVLQSTYAEEVFDRRRPCLFLNPDVWVTMNPPSA